MSAHLRWAVVGVGRAGRARCRAILEHPDCALVGVYRGRHAHDIDAPLLTSFAEIPEIADAVAICSPTEVHVPQVRAALASGLHVVCEFPLAEDPRVARELFAEADQRGRVLHVEHIELLSATARTLRGNIRQPGVRRVEVGFERPGAADIPGEELAFQNVARLHRAVDLGGEIARIDQIEPFPGQLVATGRFAAGGKLEVCFTQHPELVRRTTLEIRYQKEVWRQDQDTIYKGRHPQTVLHGQRGLFATDHAYAVRRILEGDTSYVSEDRILHVLEVADRLRKGQVGPIAL